MLDPSVFASDSPLTNAERLALWRRKWEGWKIEQWWELTHPEAPAIQVERDWGDQTQLPAFLRRQGE